MIIQMDVWAKDETDGPGKHLRRYYVAYGETFFAHVKEELEADDVIDIGQVSQEDVDRDLAIAKAINTGRKGLLS